MKTFTTQVVLLVVTSVALLGQGWPDDCEAATTQRFEPEEFEYLGAYTLPAREHSGDTGTYSYIQGAMSYAADCMGRVDPTPDDGFPGCMLMRGHNGAKGTIGLTDVPAPGGQAVTVVPLWETGIKEYAAAAFPDQLGFTNLVNTFGVAYDAGPPCAIWLSFLPFYASTKYDDTPYIWRISCDPDNPNPQGGWGNPITMDAYERNMGHLNKYGWQLEKLDAAACSSLFAIDGECLLLGSGKGSGSRDSSAGPAWAAVKRPDLASVPLSEDFTPAIYYPHPVDGRRGTGRYVGFFEQGPYTYTMFHHCNRARGGSYVSLPDGRAALVQLISEPIPNPEGMYPNSPEGRARYDADPNTPQSTDPVGYYGINECNETSAEQQQPSFWDKKRDGTMADVDCDIEVVCPNNSTGPRCSLRQFWMLLYDPADIRLAVDGEVEHWEPQPYGKVLLTGIDPYDCKNDDIGDTTFDGSHVYVSQSGGPDPKIHVYALGQAPPPADNLCDVAGGDTCENDPINCGECPPSYCYPVSSIDGDVMTIRCRDQ